MGHSIQNNTNSWNEAKILQMDPNEAIEVIMDRFGDEIKRLVYTYVQNTADTDDITQEIFVTVYRKLSTFKGKSALRSWIYSIAINKCKDYLRSWQFRNKRLKEKISLSLNSDKRIENTLELEWMKKQDANELLHCLMDLPVKYREVVILYYFKEMTTKEISIILMVKEGTVRTRLDRGRDKLKQILRERGDSSEG
ncbi:sigma-70 family RNA polymerase sigma factor [Caldibacillus lycopersici]|uniref:Sigma-70 family RNA polymerase sigma factor n=1 Tax=Perspicuibacillus lycopersici TaxID=1325689 RepID=A0AAE3LN35_9BACI|nr:sigma-70 family RNA polymerase sigma factor [Perspicuibacillus lycopersici]MCU9613541.1 sigma-70 family RNA polymerase sigma factor [Perspicuibacillus lycopersici]